MQWFMLKSTPVLNSGAAQEYCSYKQQVHCHTCSRDCRDGACVSSPQSSFSTKPCLGTGPLLLLMMYTVLQGEICMQANKATFVHIHTCRSHPGCVNLARVLISDLHTCSAQNLLVHAQETVSTRDLARMHPPAALPL